MALLAFGPIADASAAAPADGARRVALVIGNGAYAHVAALTNPPKDASDMAALFANAGFVTVQAKTDLGLAAFRRALADFELLAQGADIAAIYYSGHGIEYKGEN